MSDGELVSSGIDYITMTMKRTNQHAASWYNVCVLFLDTIAGDGNDVKSARRLGYEGYGSGGSFIGERDDGYICQISGERAQTGFTNTYRSDAHYSRIDVQCSFRTRTKATNIAERARYAVSIANQQLSSARQRDATLIESLKGGATCYIGSRNSAQFARIYNKDAQSGEERYSNVWRYELELKNVIATKTAEQFATSEYSQSQHAATMVRHWLRKRGVKAPWEADAELYALPTDTPSNSDTEARIKWLNDQVKPTIQRLLKLGLRDTVLEVLGLIETSTDNV